MLSSGESNVHTREGETARADPATKAVATDANRAQPADAPSRPSRSTGRSPLLHRADQAVIAVLVAASLGAVWSYWYLRGGAHGALIEIEADGVNSDGDDSGGDDSGGVDSCHSAR